MTVHHRKRLTSSERGCETSSATPLAIINSASP